MRLMEQYNQAMGQAAKQKILAELYPILRFAPRMPLSTLLADMRHVRKLLKPGGQVTIVEMATAVDPEALSLLLDDIGYDVEKFITERHEEWREMHDRYHIQEGTRWKFDPYIMIARLKGARE